jgi:hypothetical protein
MVDQAIDWLIQQAISLGQSAMGALGLGGEEAAPADDANDTRTADEKMTALHAAVEEAEQAVLHEPDPAVQEEVLSQIKARHNIKTLEIVVDANTAEGRRAHMHATVNPTWDGRGILLDAQNPPGPEVVIIMDLATPPGRSGFERVLEPPAQAGLPAGQWVRAHLVGQGFGQESPHGIFYAPTTLNGHIQNACIEEIIRGVYANRKVPGTVFQLTATAKPQPTSPGPRLAYVGYDLNAQLPSGEWVDLFDAEIWVPDGITPTPVPRQGKFALELENIDAVSTYQNARLGI